MYQHYHMLLLVVFLSDSCTQTQPETETANNYICLILKGKHQKIHTLLTFAKLISHMFSAMFNCTASNP